MVERKLDAEISEKVMGQRCVLETTLDPAVVGKATTWLQKDYILLNEDGSLKIGHSLHGTPIRVTVPEYSTKIWAAALVVERLCKLGFNYQMKGNFMANGRCHMAFDDQHWHGQRHRYRSGLQDSIEKAICIAALAVFKARPELFQTGKDTAV